jgi:hypothetical protein
MIILFMISLLGLSMSYICHTQLNKNDHNPGFLKQQFNVLKQLDKLVDVLENPGSLAYMVYEIEPADQPHSYREWVSEARPEDKPCCRICGRYEQGHDKKQVEVREMLGMQGAP